MCYTTNMKERLETHNSGGSLPTAQSRPWKLIACIAFKDKHKALEFEKYLKSHSGRGFAKKKFW